ncbi:MAG TPA: YraN family protein, partial [Terrimicrobiaceae bacterium]
MKPASSHAIGRRQPHRICPDVIAVKHSHLPPITLFYGLRLVRCSPRKLRAVVVLAPSPWEKILSGKLALSWHRRSKSRNQLRFKKRIEAVIIDWLPRLRHRIAEAPSFLMKRIQKIALSPPQTAPHLALGKAGEKLAAKHLHSNGYKILYRNFRAPHGGEVDIVCRDKRHNELVFVEVKARSTEEFGRPLDAVDRK